MLDPFTSQLPLKSLNTPVTLGEGVAVGGRGGVKLVGELMEATLELSLTGCTVLDSLTCDRKLTVGLACLLAFVLEFSVSLVELVEDVGKTGIPVSELGFEFLDAGVLFVGHGLNLGEVTGKVPGAPGGVIPLGEGLCQLASGLACLVEVTSKLVDVGLSLISVTPGRGEKISLDT